MGTAALSERLNAVWANVNEILERNLLALRWRLGHSKTSEVKLALFRGMLNTLCNMLLLLINRIFDFIVIEQCKQIEGDFTTN